MTVTVLGGGPVAEGLVSSAGLEELLGAADRTNRFVGEVRDVLLTGPVSGRHVRGRTYADIGPTVHVVPAVRVDRELWDAGLLEIGDAGLSKARREGLAAAVLAGVPAHGELAGLILSRVLPPVTDRLRDRVADAVETGTGPGGAGLDPRYFPPGHRDPAGVVRAGAPFDRLHAIAVTGSYLGKSWQGRALAQWYRVERPIDVAVLGSPRSFGSPEVGAGKGRAPLSSVKVLVDQLIGSTETAVAFFNSVGAVGTAGLMGIQPGDAAWRYLDPGVVPGLSAALGDASRSGALAFGGGDLISASGGGGYLAAAVPLLFTTGSFDARFLADATVAQLENHRTLDRLDGARHGTSGTNILLTRATESPEVTAAVIARLGADGAHHYLQPEAAFQPDHHGRFPITLFLGAAGVNPTSAAVILSAVADLDGGLSDAGVAGGVDAVMARHATIMYPVDHLQRRGISLEGRLSGRDWAGLGLDGGDWKRVRDLVLEHGQGAGLAAGNKHLVLEAMNADLVADGRLSSDDDHYRLLALNSGALDEQWFQRVLEIRTEQDLSAARRNNYVSAGFSVGVSLGTAVFLPATVTGAAVGVAVGGLTSGGLARFPLSIWDTDLANTELRDRLSSERRSGRLWEDAVIGPVITAAQQAGTPIQDGVGNLLTIEHHDGIPLLVATHPTTGRRTLNPTIDWHPDGRVGDEQNDTTSQIHRHYVNGQEFMDPSGSPDDPEVVQTDIQGWVRTLPGPKGN